MFIAGLLTLGVFASSSIGLALTIPSTPSINEQFASEPQSFIVKLKPGHSSRSHFSTISKGRHNLKLKSSRTTYFESNIFNGYATQLADQAAVEALSQMDSVEYVEPDVVFSVASLARQTNSPWGLQAITRSIPFPAQHGASEALNYTYEFDSTAGQGVDIYILDSGVYANHSEFGNRVQHAPVFARYTTTGDIFGHGTHVAGIAAGARFGVAKQAQIIDVKVITDTGRGFASDIIAGLSWAVAHANSTGRPCVFNFSLGGGTSTALDDAVASAVNAGFPTVVAAGNANVDIVAANWSPARVPGVITVGNVDINGVRSESSNYGSPVAVFAPGVNITSAGITGPNSTRVDSGTSMAAPYVAGLAAYLIGLEGPRSPSEMKARLQTLARVDILSSIPNGTVNLMAQNIF